MAGSHARNKKHTNKQGQQGKEHREFRAGVEEIDSVNIEKGGVCFHLLAHWQTLRRSHEMAGSRGLAIGRLDWCLRGVLGQAQFS